MLLQSGHEGDAVGQPEVGQTMASLQCHALHQDLLAEEE
ncbi:hypothetical protein AVEN_59776-1, partial [Araneus ventricosus]